MDKFKSFVDSSLCIPFSISWYLLSILSLLHLSLNLITSFSVLFPVKFFFLQLAFSSDTFRFCIIPKMIWLYNPVHIIHLFISPFLSILLLLFFPTHYYVSFRSYLYLPIFSFSFNSHFSCYLFCISLRVLLYFPLFLTFFTSFHSFFSSYIHSYFSPFLSLNSSPPFFSFHSSIPSLIFILPYPPLSLLFR